MNARQIFEACRTGNVTIEVMSVAGSAADNAAQTIDENGGKFVQGEFSDEFISYWILSVEGLLCTGECDAETVTFFESLGVIV